MCHLCPGSLHLLTTSVFLKGVDPMFGNTSVASLNHRTINKRGTAGNRGSWVTPTASKHANHLGPQALSRHSSSSSSIHSTHSTIHSCPSRSIPRPPLKLSSRQKPPRLKKNLCRGCKQLRSSAHRPTFLNLKPFPHLLRPLRSLPFPLLPKRKSSQGKLSARSTRRCFRRESARCNRNS